MVSVTLVVPSWHYFADPFKLHPLSELYFATVIAERFPPGALQVSLTDLRVFRQADGAFAMDQAVSRIPECDVYLYWIAKSADYFEILATMRQIRSRFPKSVHAAGGVHVDTFPEETATHFDAVVVGPGEESFITLINDYRAGGLKKIYQSAWENVQYDDYPIARRDFLPVPAIVNTTLFEQYGGLPATSAMFSRGCNFRCIYCYANIPHKVQMRSPKTIEREIEYLKHDYGISGVNLRDEVCVPLAPKVAFPYLEAIGRTNVKWRGQTRIGVREDIMALAAQTGLVELSLGVETVCQEVLDIIHKDQSVEQARETIRLCKKYNIKVKMCLVLGLPGEPRDILEKTIAFIEETQPEFINVSGLCPVPGTEIFRNAPAYGIKYIDPDWSKHAHLMFRFGEEESFGLPFEYETTNHWGPAFSRQEIATHIRDLQNYLRERSMCY